MSLYKDQSCIPLLFNIASTTYTVCLHLLWEFQMLTPEYAFSHIVFTEFHSMEFLKLATQLIILHLYPLSSTPTVSSLAS